MQAAGKCRSSQAESRFQPQENLLLALAEGATSKIDTSATTTKTEMTHFMRNPPGSVGLLTVTPTRINRDKALFFVNIIA